MPAHEAVTQVAIANFTPTFWGVCGLIVIALTTLVKIWPSLDKNKRDSDASLRNDLLGQLAEVRKEAAAARTETADERRRCDQAMSDLRHDYEKTERELRAQIEGLHRQMIAMQLATGRAMGPTPETDRMVDQLLGKLKDD